MSQAMIIAALGSVAALTLCCATAVFAPRYERDAFWSSLLLIAAATAPAGFLWSGVWGVLAVCAAGFFLLALLRTFAASSSLATNAVLRLLKDPDLGVRLGAVSSTSRYDGAKAKILAQAISDTDASVRLAVVRAFRCLDPKWVDGMLPLLTDSELKVREAASIAWDQAHSSKTADEYQAPDPTGRTCSYCQGSNMYCPECGRGKSGGTYY